MVQEPAFNRRGTLALVGSAVVGGIGGCMGENTDSTPTIANTPEQTEEPPPSTGNTEATATVATTTPEPTQSQPTTDTATAQTQSTPAGTPIAGLRTHGDFTFEGHDGAGPPYAIEGMADLGNGSFGSIYKPEQFGDGGTLKARVSAQENPGTYAKAGVVVANDIEAPIDGTNAFVSMHKLPGSTTEASAAFEMSVYNPDKDKARPVGKLSDSALNGYPGSVKIEREGDSLTGYGKTGSSDWREVATVELTPADMQDAGLIHTSHRSGSDNSRSEFDSLTVE